MGWTFFLLRNICLVGALLTIACLHSCRQKPQDCSRFKTGKFSYQIKQTKIKYFIDRSDSFQIERNPATREYARESIVWTGPCEYELRMVEDNFRRSEGQRQFIRMAIVKVSIIEETDSYYIFRAELDSADRRGAFSDTIFVDR